MVTIGVGEAKAQLSRLIRRIERGEMITITRAGIPVARLVPLATAPRRPGRLKGRSRVAKDFDAPLPEKLSAAFRG